MHLLVLNCGSSSIKFTIFRASSSLSCLLHGQLEAIGTERARLILEGPGGQQHSEKCPSCDYRQGLERIADAFREHDLPPPAGIGHRVVHGGERFQASVVIDPPVMAAIEANIPLAPLHNPANLEGIRLARSFWPTALQMAVFDTAFHQSMPPQAFRYAVPRAWYEDFGIRRYGFHGISHAYVAKRAAEYLDEPLENLNLITLHLGNGASAAAIAKGRGVDTSMGLTPLEGLIMGTRSGDLDAGVLLHLLNHRQMSAEELDRVLNHASGLVGLCGLSDMRRIHTAVAAGDEDARLALDMFCYRVKKYLGAYLAVLGQVDAIVFTGGIGEHDPEVRSRSLADLNGFGIRLDEKKNRRLLTDVMEIQSDRATMKILAVATDEAREIARNMLDLLPRPLEE
ncbi:acetate/propionate family kinase [Methylohalobius crimeensis]|uniref:acetate/propionate family kinase n=1 Tax=Methylohalobius crimeensis TaxID=244365 RepID=UPI0003B48670|nr:acetate kinase [Methylohalobius crimeensis]